MKRFFAIMITVLILTASLAACQSGTEDTVPENKTTGSAAATAEQSTPAKSVQSTESSAAAPVGAEIAQGDEVITTANVTSDGMIDASDIFSERDLKQTADLSEAVYFELSDNSDISITKAGVYVISGSASDASVVVDAGDEDKVQLVLNGVNISNSSAPAVYVRNADKVFVTTVDGTASTLSVTGTFTADGTTNTDAVIYSKDDLVLNGLGTLNIGSTDNGISGKDDIKITGGAVNITCTSDAIEANESIAAAGGDITINTSKDGLHAENDEDNSTGYIYICGGTFNITAGSDGIQATTVAQIDGGSITISGSEGIEATFIQLNGGTVDVSATDDGINASNKSGSYDVTIEVNGGEITVDMGQGDTDALDSNGNLYINGGTLNINANSPFDYDGQGQLNGGTVYVNGSLTTELTNQFGGGMGGGPGGMNGGMNGGMGGGRGF